MPAVTDEHIEQVRALVAAIPAGRVATYGDIAAAAGLSSPRTVGWIMRTDSADLPWHRVINASGRPARHLRARQLELLHAEGILSVDGRIPLQQHRYAFPRRLQYQPDQGSSAGQTRKRGRRRTRVQRMDG
ncbi:DNA methyltransferase [Mycobacterium botniense]|uniref:DNA methyltransferase n=1 Tax=Mycobacterium botniense TaxID=84962 RepID=A0A7I9XSV0_9MYCO|nr:DNA methyltransferase [Mycobacterium botniense]